MESFSQGTLPFGDDQASQEKQKADAEKERKELRDSVLSRVLDQSARARQLAQQVETMLFQMGCSGRIQSQLDDDQLKRLLTEMSGSKREITVKFDRRRAAIDSDEDL